MKRILTTFLSIALSFGLFAQSDWCGTMEMLENYHAENPEMARSFQQDILNIGKNNLVAQKSSNKIIVPVVIHVIHYNGIGNISRAQILDGMRILNEDFNKLNPDTSTIRSIFQNLSVSTDIEFRLARKDPNGNCTDGINRINSHLAMGPANRNAPKTLIQWDPFRYLNVWIVAAFNSPTLGGFAQFPSPSAGPANTYGLVVKSTEWGLIGTGSQGSFGGRAVTHEVGHCFELFHPFEGGCGNAGGTCVNSGDFVCDVPPQINDLGNSCSTSFNTCANDAIGGSTQNPNPFSTNVPDMVENFMGYGIGCQVMYTGGQKTRMLNAMNSYAKLISLTDTANATFTGTNDGYVAPTCSPKAEVLSFDKFVCRGGTVSFTQDSYGDTIATYNWSFPGGTPSTSTQANPTITYNTAGNYDVTLRVSNAGGTDSVTLSNYVHVEGNTATYSGFNYTESFENATSFANDWVIISPSGAAAFDRANFVGKTGSSSLWLNNLNNVYVSGLDQAISPSIKMTDVLNPTLSIDVSYRRRTSSSNDKFNLKYSLDCGNSWGTILSTTPSFFAYDNSTQTSNFFPTQGSQWKNISIPSNFIPASVRNSDRVMFMLEVEHGDGNNFYFDDFKILGQATGAQEIKKEITELSIYPNPAKDQINLAYTPSQELAQTSIYLTNVVGERVLVVYEGAMSKTEYKFQIDSSVLPKGIYFMTIDGDDKRVTRKVVIH